jgi:hypothetical protein
VTKDAVRERGRGSWRSGAVPRGRPGGSSRGRRAPLMIMAALARARSSPVKIVGIAVLARWRHGREDCGGPPLGK